MKHLPQKILAVLIIILLFLVGFTYYIQRPIPTLKRLLGNHIVLDLKDIKLDRYDTKHHPALFRFTPKSGKSKKIFGDLASACQAEQIEPSRVPKAINKVDKNLAKNIKSSQKIFLSNPDSNKSCLLFVQNEDIFLYINDKF